MKPNQAVAWKRLVALLSVALVGVCLAAASLGALPGAAAQFPNCEANQSLPAPPSGPNLLTVTGTISSHTGMPVECVYIFAFSGAAQAFTYTRSSGQYTLTLSPGTYDFVFHPPLSTGLASQARRWIRASQTLDIVLPPGYLISGTVYSDLLKTKTVSHVNVFAGNPDTFVGLGAKPTGPAGNYAVVLEKGRWELTFTPPHFLSLGPTRTANIELNQNITVDVVLPAGFTVYGRVKKNGGQGQENVDIFAQDFSQSQGYGITATDPNGFYTGTLPAGNFEMLLFPPHSSGFGSTVITNVVGPPDVRRNLTLPAGCTVSGTVTCGGGVANALVRAAPQSLLADGNFDGWGRFSAADGFYAVALQPGVYTFSVDPPGDLLPIQLVPAVAVNGNLTLNFDYQCRFLPFILKSSP